MIIFLYGPDTYRSRQKLNEIIERYKSIHKNWLNLKYFDGKDLKFEDFRDELQQASMFKEKKLVILTDIFLNPDFKEKFLKDGKKFKDTEDIVLFYETNQISGKDSLSEFLIKHAKSQEFQLLLGEKLKNWIKKEFKNSRAKIESGVPEKLVDFIGNDLWQLSNEIKKLISFKDGGMITKEDIELSVRPKIETDIFGTIDAIAAKDKKRALLLLKKHLEKGDSPIYLLSMINFQLRNLLMIKSRQSSFDDGRTVRKKLEMHPFVIRKTLQQAQNFTLEELKQIYQKIFEVDFEIKMGRIEPETALDLLIAEI